MGAARVLAAFLVLVAGLWIRAVTADEATMRPIGPRYFGLHIHDAAQTANWPVIGFDAWRLWDARVAWPDLQPDRWSWRFTMLDRLVATAESRDIEILLPLGLSPTWASARPGEESAYRQPGWAAEPARIEDWRRYVRQVMERYRGRVLEYEIWNEPNLARFFSGTVARMVELTCAARTIARAVDPGIVIVSPAATGGDDGVRWLGEFLARGGGACVDVIGFHFYMQAHEPPELIGDYVRKVRAVADLHGLARMPIWNTETGWYFAHAEAMPEVRWKITALADQPGYVMRALIVAAAAGVERFYWYAWNNRTMGGLVEPGSGTPKAAARAYATLREWLRGAHIGACAENRRVWSCPVQTAERRRALLVWSPTGRRYAALGKLSVERVMAFEALPGSTTSGTTPGAILADVTPKLLLLN